MAIQILGLRKFHSKERNAEITFDAFFEKQWRAPTVTDLFENIEKYLSNIPSGERWNLYYTCADCSEEKGRKMISQSVIPFDVDGIDVEKLKEYIPVICTALGIDPNKTGIIFSGNGLQFIVGIREAFTSTDYFEQNRVFYRALCEKVNTALKGAGLPGAMDTSVFSPARIMRLPLTLNKKPGKPERMGELYHRKIVPVAFNLAAASGVPVTPEKDQIKPDALKRFPPPDSRGVLEGCEFLKACKAEPQSIPEHLWYAMLSITARLPDGVKLSHEMSSGHPKYTHAETENKVEQALASSGPRTCANINKHWGKCSTCPHFEKIKSPILIKGKDYIATKDNGFHDFSVDKNGNPKPGKPNFEDLRRYFEQEHPYITPEGSKVCYVWNGKLWEPYSDTLLENYAYRHFRPFVKSDARKEFRDLICATNPRHPDWFMETTNRKINFQNGVLDLADPERKLLPHSMDYGFRYVLPYNYDQAATAPRFKEFLKEITAGQQDLIDVLMEFAGYAFSNDECWTAKALILTGDGANGKSTFLNILMELAGKDSYSVLNLADLAKETSRFSLDGKLFNASEETPTYSLMESSAFKGLVSGGIMQIRQLYKTAFKVKNRCKFLFACNELPQTRDTSPGLFRRLIIVPFNVAFEGHKCDPFLQKKLGEELPGIFNLVLEGYQRLLTQGKFTYSETVEETVTNYRKDVDLVETFKTDRLSINGMKEEEFTPLSKLYAEYYLYAESFGEKPEKYTIFCKRLRRHIPEYDKRIRRRPMDGKWERLLIGVNYGVAAQSF
jgi:P4 family phage/plasmid primase-like protien